MANLLLLLWHRLLGDEVDGAGAVPGPGLAGPATTGVHPGSAGGRPEPRGAAWEAAPPTSGAIFLVLRRMRTPLIVLVLVFSTSVLGLTLIPGSQPDGGTAPMTFFEAFYFMSYTATTIGFGEIPYALTTDQRMWVTFSIYVAVIGWAYAIGSLLALLQDRGFRTALDTQRFGRRVRRIPEPFHLIVGFGGAGALVARALDARGRRMVVLDRRPDRIEALGLESLRADVPALAANARIPSTLLLGGLRHPRCAGVLALTDDDQANLAVVQAAHLLRPGVPVIARAESEATAARMAPFGRPTVIDPFDAFGDRLRLTIRTPALAQLMEWLVAPPGAPLPQRRHPPGAGSWVAVGARRAIEEVSDDLRAAGMSVVALDPDDDDAGPESALFVRACQQAVGVLAAADHDTLNVAYVDAARRAKPGLFVVARQESPENAALFDALAPDLQLVPAEVVAREVLERLANPALWDFLARARGQGEQWADDVLGRLVSTCGPASPTVWQVRLDPGDAPALVRRLAHEPVSLGALMLSPFGRSDRLPLVALMCARGSGATLVPDEGTVLAADDVLLLAGGPGAPRGWEALASEDEALGYVLSGQSAATSWWGRRLLGGGR